MRIEMAGKGGRSTVKVLPNIPQEAGDCALLEKHLEAMGCAGLLDVPWGLTEGAVLEELEGAPGNQFDGTLRAHPEKWTPEAWRLAYGFKDGDIKVVERNDAWLEGEFLRGPDPKDGYGLKDLFDPEARMVIGFLNPIFHPQKPKRVVIKWAGIFLGAMRKKITVDWATLMKVLVDGMVKDIRRGKKSGTPLPVYIAHLYSGHELLSPDEQGDYNILLSIQKYGGPETEPESEEDSSSPDSPTSAAATLRTLRKRSRSPELPADPAPTTAGRPEPTPADPAAPQSGSGPPRIDPPTAPILTGRPGEDILELLTHVGWRTAVRNQEIADLTHFLAEVMKELGVERSGDVLGRLKELRSAESRVKIAEEQQASLIHTAENLRKQVERAELDVSLARMEMEEAKRQADTSARALVEVRTALAFPVDTVNRSLLYTEQLEKEEKLNRSQIIRFLHDHSRKMEVTWTKMQLLAGSLLHNTPEPAGTPMSEAPRKVPERGGPSGTPPTALPEPFDFLSTPPAGSPMDWHNIPLPSTETLATWRNVMPEGFSQESPPAFRLPGDTPPGPRRKTTPRASRRSNFEASGSGGGFQDLLRSAETPRQSAAVVTEVRPEVESGSQRRNPEPPPAEAGSSLAPPPSPRRESPRNTGKKTPGQD